LAGILKSETKFLVFRTALGFSGKFFNNLLRINGWEKSIISSKKRKGGWREG
jgi:hypothetical protein